MKDIKQLFSVLNQWKYPYLFGSFLLLFSTFFRMLEPKMLQIAIDGVIGTVNKTPSTSEPDFFTNTFYQFLPEISKENLTWVLLSLGGLFLLLAIFRASSDFGGSTLIASTTEKSIKGLRDRLFAHLQKLPLAFHQTNKTGEMIQRSTGDVDTIRRFIFAQASELVRMGGIFIFSFIMMVIVHPLYAFIAISLVPFILFNSYYFFLKEGKVWEEHEEEADKLTSIVSENLSGIRVVQAFANEKFEINQFDTQNQKKLEIGKRHVRLHAKFWPISDSFIHSQIALSIFFGGVFALSGEITVGELASFYTYAIMVTWPMRQVGQIVSQMGMANVAMQRIMTILNADPETYDVQEVDVSEIKGKFEFKNVSFKYPDSEEWVLKNVSFVINSGEKVGLIGAAGSGKSSLIRLLTRMYEPTEGEILLDNRPLHNYSKTFLRQKIGVVNQKPFLFSNTIFKNIAYARPTATENEVVEAAKKAQIHQVMSIFSDGYNTVVGEKGVSLSGGQKQRVALARTILENPEILVIDDATSAVDSETEYAIQYNLKEWQKNKTSITIAHRVTSIQNADKIITLQKGEVVQIGKPSDLIKEKGFYYDMLKVQLSLEEEILEEMFVKS